MGNEDYLVQLIQVKLQNTQKIMHDTIQNFNVENPPRGIKNHVAKPRNNSLSRGKIRTPKLYSKYIRILCKHESKISFKDLIPTNKIERTCKDSHHLA